MITSEDIERTKAMMTQMLRSFDTSLGDAVQASHRNRTATTKTGRRGQAETNTGTNAAQFQTRNAMQSLGTDTCGALGLQTPGDAPGLPLVKSFAVCSIETMAEAIATRIYRRT